MAGIFSGRHSRRVQAVQARLPAPRFLQKRIARIAIENQAPVIPAAVVGHAEIFPILGRINWSYVRREWGWPYLPIAPMFSLAPVPARCGYKLQTGQAARDAQHLSTHLKANPRRRQD